MAIVFIHGTSVREPALSQAVNDVKAGLLRAGFQGAVEPYMYGPASAVMRWGGKSIPGVTPRDFEKYMAEVAERTELPDPDEYLLADPLMELRSRRGKVASDAFAAVASRQRRLEQAKVNLAAELGLIWPKEPAEWIQRLVSAVLDEAMRTDQKHTLADLLPLIARSIAAFKAGQHDDPGEFESTLEVVRPIVDSAFGMPAVVKELLIELPLTLTLRCFRSAVMRGVCSFFGDVIWYLNNQNELLRGLDAVVTKAMDADVRDGRSDGLTVVGHSLGGIIAYDFCAKYTKRIDRLFTVGSQVPLLAEWDVLFDRREQTADARLEGRPSVGIGSNQKRQLADGFPNWMNVFDLNDFLSFQAEPVFNGVEDKTVNNRAPFPTSHSAYWRNQDVYRMIAERHGS